MKIKIAFLSALASVGVQLYLALHYYGLHFGLAEDSACNLNATFNCDAVSASSFAQIAGVPLAVWGMAANFGLAILLLGWMIRWAENITRLGAMNLLLSSFIALVSLAMGTISTFALGTYCIFCISAYILSFIQFELIRRAQEPNRKPLLDYIGEMFREARTYAVFFVAIPVAAVFFHKVFINRYGAGNFDRAIKDSLAMWAGNPKFNFDVEPSLTKGADDAEFVIVEFADFRCGHCKNAAPSLNAFVSSRKDVKLKFYSFPLDGSCNDAMQGGGDGISCYLAKAVYCAERNGGHGWAMHDGIFAAQDKINFNHSIGYAREVVEGLAKASGIDFNELNICVADKNTDTAIRAQAKAGQDARITGTPAVFVDGRQLLRGQLIPVLEAAKEAFSSSSSK